jgi:hypothetical protein
MEFSWADRYRSLVSVQYYFSGSSSTMTAKKTHHQHPSCCSPRMCCASPRVACLTFLTYAHPDRCRSRTRSHRITDHMHWVRGHLEHDRCRSFLLLMELFSHRSAAHFRSHVLILIIEHWSINGNWNEIRRSLPFGPKNLTYSIMTNTARFHFHFHFKFIFRISYLISQNCSSSWKKMQRFPVWCLQGVKVQAQERPT